MIRFGETSDQRVSEIFWNNRSLAVTMSAWKIQFEFGSSHSGRRPASRPTCASECECRELFFFFFFLHTARIERRFFESESCYYLCRKINICQRKTFFAFQE